MLYGVSSGYRDVFKSVDRLCGGVFRFCQAYEEDRRRFGSRQGMTAKPGMPANCFTVSMIPWTSFDGFHLNLQKGYDYLLPIFTMGKFYEEQGKVPAPSCRYRFTMRFATRFSCVSLCQ